MTLTRAQGLRQNEQMPDSERDARGGQTDMAGFPLAGKRLHVLWESRGSNHEHSFTIFFLLLLPTRT